MIRARALALLLLVPSLSFAAEVERPGAAATLCRELARSVAPALSGGAVRLEVTAEGPALDLASSVRAACAAALPVSPSGSALKVRLRVGDGRLLALFELSGMNVRPFSSSVEAPLDDTTRRWVSAGNSGLETMLVGQVDVDALAVCGRASDDGLSLFFVSRTGIHRARWEDGGLDPLETIAELPTALRPRARAPAVQLECLPDGGLRVGVPDRNREATITRSAAAKNWTWVDEHDGLSFGEGRAIGRSGTPLVDWKNRSYGAFAIRAGAPLALATQDGRLFLAPTPEAAPAETRGAWSRVGTALAWLQLPSLAKTPVLVTSRALLPGDAGDDGLVVLRPASTPEVLVETARIGPVRAIAVVRSGTWERAVALVPAEGRTDIFAFGPRHPTP